MGINKGKGRNAYHHAPTYMPKYVKLTLDIVIGAVLPVAILKYGTAPLGTLPAYLAAALIPVAWVLLDLFVISRRFNFITTYGGLGAIMRGALAFWYVSGALFAFKDSASYLLAVFVFGGTLFVGKPVTRAIALQGLGPDTPEREASLERLLDEPTVISKLRLATLAIALTNLGAGLFNYWINFHMVKAPFGTPLFNDQVANVNAITRVVLVLPDMICLFWAFSAMYKAIYALLPPDQSDDPRGDEFWDLVSRREAALVAGPASEMPVESDEEAQSRANKQAREEFGLG
ncbi:MAG: VC0807 family protein [Gemmatimonadaceae bacterium]